jgi:hypothetical protein
MGAQPPSHVVAERAFVGRIVEIHRFASGGGRQQKKWGLRIIA